MEYIAVFSIIFSFATSLVILLKRRIEQVIPIAVVAITLIIFISGMFDNLIIGTYVVYFLTICCLCFIIATIIKKDRENKLKELLQYVITPGLVIYVALFIFNIWINQNRIFENYDEFRHWAVIIKNMFLYGTYGTNPESIVMYNDYPPFTAAFQYLFLSVGKVYREDFVIMAQNLLYFSIIIPITKNLKWNFKGWLKSILLIIIMPIIFYKNFYLEILVDGILGVMFAYTIYSAYQNDETKVKYTSILDGLIMLSLTKTTGIALAILAIIIIAIMETIRNKENKTNLKREMKAIIIVILITSLLVGWWYVKAKSSNKMWDFKQLGAEETNRDEKEITEIFVETIFKAQAVTDKRLTVISTTFLLVAMTIIFNKMLKDKEYKQYSITMLITIPIYLVGLLLIYLRIFEPIEAMVLACFERYVSTILLAVVIFQAYVMEEKIEYSFKSSIIVIAILIALVPLENVEEKYIEGRSYIKKAQIKRNAYTKIKKYNNKFTMEDRILYIAGIEADSNYLSFLNNYELMPNRIKNVISGNYSEVEGMIKAIKDYDYVYIYRMKQENQEAVKEVFQDEKVENDILYKVINEDNKIVLEKVK